MNEILGGLIIAAGGSLVNFIATKAYNSATGSSKNFIWRNTERRLNQIKTNFDFEELKKKVRIVVIDDEDSFPINLFQAEEYSVDKWDIVKDYGKLESGYYDIIILDIKGVATHISAEDGLGVLESLKRTNPAQIIIAYSQHSFDLSKTKFWEMADEKIAKPSDFLKIKGIVDNLINTKFKPSRYIDTLYDILKTNAISKRDLNSMNKKILETIDKREKANWKKIFFFIDGRTELQKQLVSIGNTMMKFFQ